ncbi:MAG: cation:proton antiporter [Gammaproteobacteria bacterium]|nr:cation:proton antiporter [Gammaproteobacteria bacterium]
MSASVHQTENLLFAILLQVIVMIGAARLGNTLLRRLGQPGVVGEIMAGLLLGPSLFGHFFPQTSLALFGAQASTPIVIISQIGLILLMFQIGMDFEFGHLRNVRNRGAVAVITLASIGVPFALGLWFGRASAAALAPGIDPLVYSLFCGVGLAITAVPILGRILREYGLTRTEVGVVAISAAAVNDVIGWVLLAGVYAYATARFSGTRIALQLGGLALFIAVLWFVLRPLVRRLIAVFPLRDGEVPPNLMASVICLMFATGICTYRLGIFAIFGGFAAGLLFHHFEAFVTAWRRQVGQFVLVFFLPVFFTFTGLRTNVLGLSSGADLSWLAFILAAAILGKIFPVYAAARVSGFAPNQAWVLGSLMNTRALMELIVLNIGLDLGFIPAQVFTMLVIMAILTTVMTGPLLKYLLPRIGHVMPVGLEA